MEWWSDGKSRIASSVRIRLPRIFFAPVANVISASLESSLRVTNLQAADNHPSVLVDQKVMKAICAREPTRAQTALRSLLMPRTARQREKTPEPLA